MNIKEVIMRYRNTKRIKGIKPAYITLKRNGGKIYNSTAADFIMSIRDDVLYFQRLTFLKNLKPNLDFEINLKNFQEYSLITLNSFTNCLYLYDKKNCYINIFYNKGLPETYLSEDNISRIIVDLEKMGIKEIKSEDEKNGQTTND